MGWILFILLFLFVIWPMLRVGYAVHRTRKKMRDAYNRAYEQAFGTPPPGARGSRRSRDVRPEAPARRKIIAKDVGEYVDFEEVNSYAGASSGSAAEVSDRGRYKAESQIEDVEWEDIK